MSPSSAATTTAALLSLFVAVLASTEGDASTYTFPAKSLDLAAALPVDFHKVIGSVSGTLGAVTNLHAVHGCQTEDGGFIACGKGAESEASTLTVAFCVKYDARGGIIWAWKSGQSGASAAANAVVPISPSEVVVVGWRTVGATGRRFVAKLKVADGTEVWVATNFGDEAGMTSFYEMVEVVGGSVYLAGGVGKNGTAEMAFKSYGNVGGGQAVVQKMPLAVLASATPPAAADVVWTKIFGAYDTAKAARPVAGSKLAVLLYGKAEARHAALAVLDAGTGNIWWGPKNYAVQGEGTDIQASKDGASVVIAGQGGSGGVLDARLTKVAVVDGRALWTRSYSSCGDVGPLSDDRSREVNGCNRRLIINQCWGAATLPDGGYALSCRTGIDGCEKRTRGPALSSADMAACVAGNGDTRAGAYARPPSVWQSLIIRTDSAGTLQWQRVDSWRAPGSPDLGVAGWTPASSAAEWVLPAAGGGLAVITDQASGTGLLKLVLSPQSGGDGSSVAPPPTASPWTWVPAPRLCVGWAAECKSPGACTKVAYGPCDGAGTSPEMYVESTPAGLFFVDETNYLACTDPTTCPGMRRVESTAEGYRDISVDEDGPRATSCEPPSPVAPTTYPAPRPLRGPFAFC